MIDYQKLWQYNLGYAVEINNMFIDKMKKINGEGLFMFLLLPPLI